MADLTTRNFGAGLIAMGGLFGIALGAALLFGLLPA
jgi:hypothetical protein